MSIDWFINRNGSRPVWPHSYLAPVSDCLRIETEDSAKELFRANIVVCFVFSNCRVIVNPDQSLSIGNITFQDKSVLTTFSC